MVDVTEEAWTALKSCLERRSRELHEAVRAYPTPIARCDEQLTKAIEDRDMAFRELRLARELDRLRATVAREEWCARLLEFAARLDAADDAALAAASERLIAAVRH